MNLHSEELLEALQSELSQLKFPDDPEELYEPVKYTLALGGKRLRPILVLLGSELFQGDRREAMKAALAIEVFHNFTLVHDDIMDEAPIRRGKPAVHVKWNRDIAILSGDAMLIKAYDLLTGCRPEVLPSMLRLFNKTAFEVCEGQQFDMNFEKKEEVTVEQYLRMIELKTAVLLAASLKLGALSAGASEADAERLYQFGRHIGIAFQLKDDWLDAYADPEKFGKRVGGDIIAGKKTYLLIRAFEKADEEQARQLRTWIADKGELISEDEKVKKVKELFNELQLSDELSGKMNAYFQKGMAYLQKVEAASGARTALQELAELLMTRER